MNDPLLRLDDDGEPSPTATSYSRLCCIAVVTLFSLWCQWAGSKIPYFRQGFRGAHDLAADGWASCRSAALISLGHRHTFSVVDPLH